MRHHHEQYWCMMVLEILDLLRIGDSDMLRLNDLTCDTIIILEVMSPDDLPINETRKKIQ